jgi:hypothetical protein
MLKKEGDGGCVVVFDCPMWVATAHRISHELNELNEFNSLNSFDSWLIPLHPMKDEKVVNPGRSGLVYPADGAERHI